jgi:hypothetical protein
MKTKPALQYRKTLNIFKATNVDFNAETMLGHSYDWYELTKSLKGRVVLNSYNYSPTTCKHISKVRSVLSMLGIRYVELEAPKGLQNLDVALEHVVSELGTAIVENKYARIKSKRSIQYFERQLKLLAKLGKRASKNKIEMSVINAEKNRKDRNAENKFKRDKRRLENYLENSVAFRDYEVIPRKHFGNADHWAARKVAVHQVVDRESMERDVENALHSFSRDGFGSVVFYV